MNLTQMIQGVLTPKRRRLQCCVCGADAGMFQQHWNRDTGYGICRKCVDWVASKMSPAEMQKSYGVEGINYQTKETP